ncbi:arylsulfatase B [Trichonephila clavipes]|nr:arylsulfatase B [Trichonephila clavipes]
MGTYFQVLILIGFYFANGQKSPHIIFTVADDLGWNDVSWHNSNIFTPNLEALTREAVILNQSYVQPVCTPYIKNGRIERYVRWLAFKSKSVNSVARSFRNSYGKEAPTNKSIVRWYHQFEETGCLCKRKAVTSQASRKKQ